MSRPRRLPGLAAAFEEPAERVRLRKAAGLSLEQVAKAVGVGRQTVANWEAGGLPSSPSRGKYLRLLEGLTQIHPAAESQAETISSTAAVQQPPVAEERDVESPAARAARAGHDRHQARRRTSSAEQVRSELRESVAAAVEQELTKAGGDADAASAALVKRAIPDVMGLFARTRAGARYEYTAYPALPDLLRKPSKTDPDLVWEARPSWRHPGYRRHSDGELTVTALDVNAAYLSALKTWLPIGKLTHSAGGEHDRKRSGVHLITAPPGSTRTCPPRWETARRPDRCG